MRNILIVCIPLGILAALLAESVINKVPERLEALQFARSNQAVLAWFGDGAQVSDYSDYPASVATSFDGRREGRYCFRVEGSKKSGRIVVDWVSNRGKHQFEVTQISEYVEDGEKDTEIWQSE